MNYFKTLLALAVLTLPSGVMAEGEQLYFIGKTAPAGALTDGGPPVAYLRWDVVEGALPAALTGFRLLRDGAVILETPAWPQVAPVALERLYAGPANAARKASIIARLDGDRGNGPRVTAANFTQVLAARLNDGSASGRAWARLASRLDVNVARALGRAHVDVEPGALYRLEGVSEAGRVAFLGEVSMPRNAVVPPPAADLAQVLDLNRCDAPERGRKHGVVALTWDHPGGEGSGDQYAHGLDLAGYTIYRATAAGPLQNFDLRTLALGASLDALGRPVLPGLEPVTDAPIAISGRPDAGPDGRRTEPHRTGWNPGFAQHMQTRPELEEAGLKPGDTRAYYVVGRDFTGNWGETARLLVTVPDALAPPAPTAARAVPQQRTVPVGADTIVERQMILEWPHLDPRNYHAGNRDGRVWCNLATARDDRRLVFAGADGDCSAPFGEVNLDVAGYLVYRFDSATDAGGFTDADGDGVSDRAEQQRLTAKLSLPGTACDPAVQPAGADNHLVASVGGAAVRTLAGRTLVRFADDQLEVGRRYWYRIAALGRNGEISALGAPIAAFIPASDKPETIAEGDYSFGVCAPYAYDRGDPREGVFAEDRTGMATSAQIFCTQQQDLPGGDGLANMGEQPMVGQGLLGRQLIGESPITEIDGVRVARHPPLACAFANQGCQLVVAFRDADGGLLGDTPVVTFPGCGFTAVLDQDCAQQTEPIADGDGVNGQVVLDMPQIDVCVDVTMDVDGDERRLDTVCPNEWPWTFDAPDLGGDMVCLSVTAITEDGVAGTRYGLPCYKPSVQRAPEPPQLLDVVYGVGDAGTLRWRSPAQPTAGIMVQWYRTGAQLEATTRFFGHEGRYGPEEIHTALFEPGPRIEVEETFCVRARSVARRETGNGSKISDWTTPLCVERAPPGVALPEYLPWPAEPEPAERAGDLPGRYIPLDAALAVNLNRANTAVWDDQCDLLEPLTPCGEGQSCIPEAVAAVDCDICSASRAALGDNVRMVVYRQARADAQSPAGHFKQVSPFLDGSHCRTRCTQAGDDCQLRACDHNDGVNGTACRRILADPYVTPLAFPDGDDWPAVTMAFVDRTPHVSGREYRFQFVYFDGRSEILARRNSAWIQAVAP